MPILFGDEARAFEMARRCHLQGLYAMPVAYPAVARGKERLRMNVTCDHTFEDLDHAVSVLVSAHSGSAIENASEVRR